MLKPTTRLIAAVATLIAAEVVLSRFLSINTQTLKIGFGFVPIALCAALFGPYWAAAAGAAADFLGAALFPVGAFFPGFTLSAALSGMVYGLFLYRNPNTLKICAAVVVNCFAVGLLINTFWLSLLWGVAYGELLPLRLLQYAVMLPIQTAVLIVIVKPVRKALGNA